LKVPVAVGVPLIVIVFEAHAAVTPAGNPVAEPIPVAVVVVCVMLVIAVFTATEGDDEAAPAAQTNTLGVNPVVLLLAGGGENPNMFLAITQKKYKIPGINPFTVIGEFEPFAIILEDKTKSETGSFVFSARVRGLSLLVSLMSSINTLFRG
jgi:hypothetical protein